MFWFFYKRDFKMPKMKNHWIYTKRKDKLSKENTSNWSERFSPRKELCESKPKLFTQLFTLFIKPSGKVFRFPFLPVYLSLREKQGIAKTTNVNQQPPPSTPKQMAGFQNIKAKTGKGFVFQPPSFTNEEKWAQGNEWSWQKKLRIDPYSFVF